MGKIVVDGAPITCPFGAAVSTLKVTSQDSIKIQGKPAATVQDGQNMNIPPFGLCSSLTNPAVASATTAAFGVLTPQPCTMATAGAWTPVKTNILINGKPCLTDECTLLCTVGQGVVSVKLSGQEKVMIK